MKRMHIFIAVGVVIAVLIAVIIFGPSVVQSWQPAEALAKFKSLVEGANRVAVTAPAVLNEQQKVYFTESDSGRISELIDSISFSRFGGGTVCACHGDAMIKFYRDDELLLEVNSQHKEYIRWQGWYSDTRLKEDSTAFLVGWIKERATDEQLELIWPDD